MTTLDFLNTLYGGASHGFLTVWTLADKRTAFFSATETASAVSYAESRFAKHDVYFGVGLRKERLGEHQRGGNDDVGVIPAFWSDIDVKGDAHKETALPETADIALDFLNTLPLKPSIVVNSGNGLHVYWLFDKPLGIATDAHRANIAAALSGWQKHVNAAAKERGWKLDSTSDLARVLRVPGGINHKLGDNARVVVIENNAARYTPQDFTPYITMEDKPAADSPLANKSAEGGETFNCKIGAADKVIEQCAFIRHCRDNAASLAEPHWYAMVGNLSLCSDGLEVCHAFSKAYPSYNPAETDKKIRHALQQRKPHTCEYIRSALGFDCGNCAAGCKAPVALAVITRADEVRERLTQSIEDYGVIFSDEYIAALSYAKAKLPGEYAQFKQKHKGKISVRDVENCIKDHDAKQHRAEGGAALSGAALNLEGIDLGGAVVPAKWQVSIQGGVRRVLTSKDSESESIACPDPVVITRRLVNLDDDKERLELSFYKDGRWKSVVGNRTQVYNKASILGFGDEGLHVTSGTAAELVHYLSDYEISNKSVIPCVSSIARLGWLDGAGFFPYAVDKEILFEEDKGTATLYRNLAEQGDYGVWKEMMVKLRKNPIARFITSAAFASPLLCKIGVRTFVIHLWHNSASGKSAALKAAISVWGNPLRIMGNGFTTIVGTEQLAGTLRNLPFGIDEKQSADERRLSLEQLVYVLGQGSGKIRGAKGGGNAEVAIWHNVVMLTGEEPITRNSSLDGIQTRTFEIYGRPIDDVEFAKDAHIVSENNYGFAGAVFMRAVCAILKNDPDYLKNLNNQMFSSVFKSRGLKNLHADYVSAVALGDYLAETIIFGTDKETAYNEALKCGETVYALNEQQMSTDVIERAWDFVSGWLVSNEGRFSHDASPYYGKKAETPGGQFTEFYVIPQYLDEELEKAGFNVKKTFQGFKERGLIATQADGGGKTVRTKVKTRIGDALLRCYLFKLGRDGIVPLSGNQIHAD
jgi:bacterioferritin-associated ferredoxin